MEADREAGSTAEEDQNPHPCLNQKRKDAAPKVSATRPKRFWQRRFYDFNVWSRGKLKEKLNYMHANPVTRKLVKHPKNWPWSSWSFYEKGEGVLLQMDVMG